MKHPVTFRSVVPLALVLLTVGHSSAAPVEIIPPELHGALQPQIAIAPSGRIHVTFGKGNAVYHTTAPAPGRHFSPPVRVATLPKLALGMRRGPRIVATDKVLGITAISLDDGTLHGWASHDGGATWKGGVSINDVAKSAREGLHAMAGDGRGNALVTWLDLRSGSMELWRATSADGGATWSANALIYKSPDGHICECCHPSATMDAQGRAAVMWRNWLGGSRDMFAALSSDGGKSFGAAQKLGAGTWKLNACPMDGGAIALDATGHPLSVWRREKTAFASGITEPEQQLADPAVQPFVVSVKGGTRTLWESGGGLMMKSGNSAPVRFAEKATFAAGAPLPNGGAAIVWQSEAGGAKTLLFETID